MGRTRRGVHTLVEIMRITLNGKLDTGSDFGTVADLLHRLELDPVRVAVEINEDLLPRGHFTQTRINDGDRIEIVTFVGGG